MVTLWASGALDWSPLAAVAEVRTIALGTPVAAIATTLATAPADGLVIAPHAWPQRPTRPAWQHRDRPLPHDDDLIALDDDDAWAEAMNLGLKQPWFWLTAGTTQFTATGGGALVVVIPRRVIRTLEGPDEATVRATLKGFVRATHQRTVGTGVRVNLVELAGRALDPAAAELIAWLASPSARAVAGQILEAR